MRMRLVERLTARGSLEYRINGPADPAMRLPNTLSISFRGVHSGLLLKQISARVAASAGSACHTGGGVSAILRKIRVPAEFAAGTLRLSVGRHTLPAHVDT